MILQIGLEDEMLSCKDCKYMEERTVISRYEIEGERQEDELSRGFCVLFPKHIELPWHMEHYCGQWESNET